MTDHPCNCSTCDNPKCPLPRYFNGRLEKFVPGQMINSSKIVGCLQHPQAREYLMKDVINELNQWGKEAEELNRTEESKAYVDAIALIRDGVKKE